MCYGSAADETLVASALLALAAVLVEPSAKSEVATHAPTLSLVTR